jgi:hypothetical protein
MVDPFAVSKYIVISRVVTIGSVSSDLFIIRSEFPYSCDKIHISIASFITVSFGVGRKLNG